MEHHLAEKGTLKNNHLNLTAADHERKFLSVRTFSAKIFSFHVVLVGWPYYKATHSSVIVTFYLCNHFSNS